HLSDCRSGSLRHETLGWRRNHSVFGRHQVPAWLALPGRLADFTTECLKTPGNLRIRHERGLFRLHVAGKRSAELRLVEKKIAVPRWQDWRHGCIRRRIFDERVHRLACVWSKGSDVDKPDNLWIGTGFGDHRATVGVAHQNHRAILFVNNELRRRYIASQRKGRILDDRDIVVILLQQAVDTFPTRTV